MKITHHYIPGGERERLRRQAAIHRRCLLLIRALPGQAPAARDAG